MRRSYFRKRQLNLESLEPRRVLDSTVVFNELMYHPDNGNEALEWIELHNQMAVNMDLSGWSLAGGIEYTFPDGTILAGGGYLVVAADPAAFQAETGLVADAGPFGGRLANSGETLSLINNSNRLMDEITYEDGGRWPVGPDGSGVTLAKLNPLHASGPPANWAPSGQIGGTPGAENFVVEPITRLTYNPVSSGSTTDVLIPTNNSLGTQWRSPSYAPGSLGETWTSGPTNTGFAIDVQGTPYDTEVLADNPLVYWRIGETTSAQPALNQGLIGSTGNGIYHFSATLGAPSLIEEQGDRSLDLSTATAVAIRTGFFEKLAPFEGIGGTGKTLEFWFSPESIPTTATNLVGDAETSTDLSHSVYLTEEGRIRTSIRTRAGFLTRTNSVDSDRVIQPGEVVHVASTWDAATGEIRLYLNGQLSPFTTSSGVHPTTGTLQNTDNRVLVGRDGQTTSSLNGLIDEIAVYNYPLASSRVSAHYEAGQPSLDGQIATDIEGLMHNVNPSAYIRIPFDVPTDVAIDQLRLEMRYDDGFVAYLNGTEVARRNAPATVAFNSAATADRSLADVLTTESFQLNSHLNLLQPTGNLLAIQGLNASAGNGDFLIAPKLIISGNSIPESQPPAVAINEVASATDANFRVELANDSDQPIQLAGFVLTLDAAVPVDFVLPAVVLPAGGHTAFDAADLGFDPASGDRLFLYNPGKTQLLDAREVTNRLRGRSAEHDGRWLFPDVATFGAANSFDFTDQVVINEIMYHAQPQFASSSVPSTTTLIPIDADWNYHAPAGGLDGLNPAWYARTYNDNLWSSGPGPFGNETAVVDYAQTVLDSSPLGYWRLGESSGTTITDLSGNGHHGTASPGVVLDRPSLIGDTDGAINPNGSNRVTIPAFEKFPAGSTGYTVEFWFRMNGPASLYNIVGDGESGGDWYLMNYLIANGSIRPHFAPNNSPVSMDSVAKPVPGQVYHVVTTWDRTLGRGRIYIDGQLDSEIATTTNVPSNTNNPLYFGQDGREPSGNFDLDEVAIYNRALSPSEIASHYAAGVGAGFTTELPIGPTTHYFRHEFQFDGIPAETELRLRTAIDDGAVYYLNGVEVYRQNMPAGAVQHQTLSSTEVEFAQLGDEIVIPSAALVNGTNVLAVEVHQASASNDPDVHFAAELSATTHEGANRPFSESSEEWIELFNRGTTTVDLSGWQLSDGVDFEFPAGTTIEPGAYLLIANDATYLASLRPGIASQIVGSFTGTLSNAHDRLELLDAVGNPADLVEYYDAGQWAGFADGGGSSLELRDPDADNSSGAAWAASDQGSLSPWHTYTYRGIAANPPGSNFPTTHNEFSFGLLDGGELLIDDIHVIEDPDGAAIEFLQNSTFESGLTSWRPVGNQRGQIVPDPDNPNNNVLHLTATGNEEHLQNHVETTLRSEAGYETVQLGTEYEISFRAKWLGGSPQLNTRLFFNTLPRTTILETTPLGGTPGASNSTLETNIGPTYDHFRHAPITPDPGEEIAVFANVNDPDGVGTMTVWYSVNGGGWQSSVMSATSGGEYLGVIPGQSGGSTVQFYVEGQDTLGAVSTFPAAGRDSRALIAVGQGASSTTGLHNLRIIMTAADEARLAAATNLMSNDRLGATVVYQGEVFYDAGVRLKGSEHGRADANRRGLNIAFPPDQLFRGVHSAIAIDRSGGWRFGTTFGQDEMVIHQFINRAGNVPSMFNDLVFVDGPGIPDGTAILQMARFNDVFLDSQFDNGADGTNYEYELIYTMLTSGGVETLKTAQEGPSVFGIPVGRDLGDDKEAYRHYFLIKNNRAEDDYDGMIALAKAFSLSGNAFLEAADEVIDVDQWMRAFAALTLTGAGDNYHSGAQHNAHFYQRPSDGKMLLFPFDMDFAFTGSSTAPLVQNGDLTKLLASQTNRHAFLGHLHDIVTSSFNSQYMQQWTTHYSSLLPGQDFSSILTWIDQRRNFVMNQLPPQTPFLASGEPPIVSSETLVESGTQASALIPSVANGGSTLGTTWTQRNFVESAAWLSGSTGVGYETSPADYQNLIGLNVGAMLNTNQSVFVRIPFEFQGDTSELDRMILRMKYDDGFVAYLNGTRIAAANAPGAVTWNSGATASHDDAAAVQFQDFNVSQFVGQLVQGTNVLAIHGLNTSLDSSDLLFLPELIVEDVQEGNTEVIVDTPTATISGQGWVNVRDIYLQGAPEPLVVTWTSPTDWQATIPVAFGTHDVTFEAYDFGGQFIGDATITVTSTANEPDAALRITEINYNPVAPTAAELAVNPGLDNDDFEFLEIQNVGTTSISLAGYRITDGIEFTFPAVNLAAGSRAVIVQNTAAFDLRYGDSGANVLGEFSSGRLNNDGERLTLVDIGGNEILSFEFEDDGIWPEGPDGTLGTLQWIAPAGTTANQQSKFYHWQGSSHPLGSPGSANVVNRSVMFSEVLLPNPAFGVPYGAVELKNISTTPINLSGAWLSDDETNLQKFRVPNVPALDPGQVLVFDVNDFQQNPAVGSPSGLVLDGTSGGELWLTLAGNLLDHMAFGPSVAGTSWGRLRDTGGPAIALSHATLGGDNAPEQRGTIVVSEIQYHPGAPSSAALAEDPTVTEDDLEFLELHNAGLHAVDLSGWLLQGGVDYEFPQGISLAAGESLVLVSFDPQSPAESARAAAFRAQYNLGGGVRLLGAFGGQMQNASEALELLRRQPGLPGDPSTIFVTEDFVVYDDVAPWPSEADGSGSSAQRIASTAWGNAGASWQAALPTPGAASFVVTSAGDFNGDQTVDALDVDILHQAIRQGLTVAAFDLDSSGSVDAMDRRFLLEELLDTSLADANLDGFVDGADFLAWSNNRFDASLGVQRAYRAQSGGDLSAVSSYYTLGTWERGDFNGDGFVDGSDFNIWNRHAFVSVRAAQASGRSVPRAPLAADTPAKAVDVVWAERLLSQRAATLARRHAVVTPRTPDAANNTGEIEAFTYRRSQTAPFFLANSARRRSDPHENGSTNLRVRIGELPLREAATEPGSTLIDSVFGTW